MRDGKHEERRLRAINSRVDWDEEPGFRSWLVVMLLARTRTHRCLVLVATTNVGMSGAVLGHG